jgi:hypothetical protein
MTMAYLECKTRRSRTGNVSYHHVLVIKHKGVRTRKYLCKVGVPVVRYELEKARAMKRIKSSLLSAMSNGQPGPLPKIPDYQRQLLKDAGFTLDGGMRVFRNRKTYYTHAAASVRLSMKDSGVQSAIGTADNLMRLERGADSMQKSLTRRKVSGKSFEDCLAAVISDYLKHRNTKP